MYEHLSYKTSEELCEQMSQESDTAILAFSTGKDSLASWLQMRKYFKTIIPYYNYYIPKMQFVEDSLKYYEDYFGCHIWRLPHPSLLRWLTYGVYETPDRANVFPERYSIDLKTYTNDTCREIIRHNLGLADNVYCGVGVRQADSLSRRTSIAVTGAVSHTHKTFFPVYDWLKADLLKAFYDAKIHLPVDYAAFGRTFDGLMYQYLEPMQKWFPDDYALLLKWFPLAELEFGRVGEPEKMRKRADFA